MKNSLEASVSYKISRFQPGTRVTALIGLARQHLDGLQRRDFMIGDALVYGDWVCGEGRQPVIDPATGDAFADCASCHANDVRAATAAAEGAFPAWRELLPA